MKTAILTDTNSTITWEEAEKNGIFMLASPYIIDGVQYYEDKDMDNAVFDELLRNARQISTSQSSPGEVLAMWDHLLESYDEIVVVPLSSALSGAVQTLNVLCSDDKYEDRVFIADDHTVASCTRISVYMAAEMAKAGKSGKEIKAFLEQNQVNGTYFLAVPTLDYLKKGGRLTPAAAALGNALGIRPVLKVNGGKVDIFTKYRTRQQCLDVLHKSVREMLEHEYQDPDARDTYLMINFAANSEMAMELEAMFRESWPEADLSVRRIPGLVACHTGPDALAAALRRKISI